MGTVWDKAKANLERNPHTVANRIVLEQPEIKPKMHYYRY